MNPEDVSLMIPIEVLVREFDSRLFLALNCLKSGAKRVVIGRTWYVEEEMFTGKSPYVYLAKGYNTQESFYDRIARSGGRLAVLDEEGGVYAKETDVDMKRGGKGNPFMSKVERAFFWGEKYLDDFQLRNPSIPKTSIVVSGNPRFDLCKKEFDSYYQQISSTHNKPQKYILVNTVFSIFNNFLSREEEVSFSSKYHKRDRVDQALKRMYDHEESYFYEFLNALRHISELFPEYTIVIRPHPVEKRATYEEYFKSDEGIIVAKGGCSHEWMTGALFTIHNGCTTGIEAYLGEKDMVCYMPEFDEKTTPYIPYKISRLATSEKELVELASKKIANPDYILNKHTPESDELIREIIANIDFSSTQKITEELLALAGERYEGERFDVSFKYPLYKRFASAVCPEFIKKILKSKQSAVQQRMDNKFPGLTKEMLAMRINAFSSLPSLDLPKIKIKKLRKDLFELTCE